MAVASSDRASCVIATLQQLRSTTSSCCFPPDRSSPCMNPGLSPPSDPPGPGLSLKIMHPCPFLLCILYSVFATMSTKAYDTYTTASLILVTIPHFLGATVITTEKLNRKNYFVWSSGL